MRHNEFIAKMARYKPMTEWYAVDYCKRHKDDPQWPELADETHASVLKLSKLIDMSSKESLRKSLCDKFMANSTNGSLNHKVESGIRISALVKLMKISGLNWFYLNGLPKVHWDEKP